MIFDVVLKVRQLHHRNPTSIFVTSDLVSYSNGGNATRAGGHFTTLASNEKTFVFSFKHPQKVTAL